MTSTQITRQRFMHDTQRAYFVMLLFKIQPSPADLRVPLYVPSVPTRAQNTPRASKRLLQVTFAATQTRTLSRKFAQISPTVHFQRTL